MKTFKITIEASDESGVIISLNEIRRKIDAGYISGMDSNDDENYSFNSEGEYEND